MKTRIRNRTARIDMALFALAAGLWVLCPYLLLNVSWASLLSVPN